MWRHVFRRKFATVCNSVQITLPVAHWCEPFVTPGSGAQHRIAFPLATCDQSKEEQERLSGLALSHLAFHNPVGGAERAIPPLTGRWWNIFLVLVNPAILVQTQLKKRQASSPRPGKISSLSKEFCFMAAGISCYALSFFQGWTMGKKVEAINLRPEHLSCWGDRLWIHCAEANDSYCNKVERALDCLGALGASQCFLTPLFKFQFLL